MQKFSELRQILQIEKIGNMIDYCLKLRLLDLKKVACWQFCKIRYINFASYFLKHIFLDMSIWERWHDKRLEYNASAGRNLILSGTNTDEIWKPDLWVVDERGGDAEKYPKMQAVAVINPNGTVTYSQR